MGQEFPTLGRLLTTIAYQVDEDNITATINATEWAPWNIFIGPEVNLRNDNPGKGEKEENRPSSFDEMLWDRLSELFNAIQVCWQERYNLQQRLTQPRGITVEKFRSDGITALATYDSRTAIPPEDSLLYQAKEADLKKAAKPYAIAVCTVIHSLKVIRQRYRTIRQRQNFNTMHQTNIGDWVSSHGELILRETTAPQPTGRGGRA